MLYETDLEIAKAFQYFARVVAVTTGIQYCQQASPQQRIQPTLAGRTQLINLELRQHFEATLRPDLGVDQLVIGQIQGRISIGVLLAVISQMSIMSELDTAMQPLVQS